MSAQQIDTLKTYKRLWPFVKPYLFRLSLVLLLTIPAGGMDSLMTFGLKVYMDQILSKQPMFPAWVIPLAIVAFTAIQGLILYSLNYLDAWVSQKITMDIKRALYQRLVRCEAQYFDQTNSAHIVTYFSANVDIGAAGLIANTKGMLTRLFSTLSLIGVLIWTSWSLAIIALVCLGLTVIPVTQIRKRARYLAKLLMKNGANLLTVYNETFGGNRVIAAYNLQGFMSKRFDATLQENFRTSVKNTQITAYISPLMHLITGLGVGLVLWAGSEQVLSGQMTYGTFTAFIAALLLLYQPVKALGNTFVAIQRSFYSLDQVFLQLGRELPINNSAEAKPLARIHDGFRFENVTFEYREGQPVLRHVDLDIRLGETLALVGGSGGGKSTIVALLPRFYDVTEGRITVDGVDIRDVRLDDLREQIAYVFQDNFLFEGTIRENIAICKPSATDEEIWQVVQDAYLDDFIASLPEGLDSPVGERGSNLSGGQRQRVAIARALLKNAPLIVLDEATSALDNKSEAIVQKAIDKLMQNRTVVVIAHRLSTIHNADRIVVMSEGQVAESGNHDELMAIENGIYRNLYLTQYRHIAEESLSEGTTV
jgi:subfamily B ATP-binding cassette protein MsbA